MELEFNGLNNSNPKIDPNATFSVREVNETISSDSFPSDIWVKGEVQRLRFHSSGHIYFDLVDSSSKSSSASTIPVTLLKWNASKIKSDLREILVEDREVRLLARPDFYAPYGKMSLAASDIDSSYSLGQIAMARRLLLDKLASEGILKANANLELNEFVVDLALITSIDSAAYHDVIDQFKVSNLGFNIIAINALMQGSESVDSVVRALKYANGLEVDAILLCRGGGAKSDLATFDNEKVVRAITNLDKPLISGLGHQIDVSVTDIAAYHALKTPTACAQFLIERTQEGLNSALELTDRINDLALDAINTADLRLANVASRLGDVKLVLERTENLLVAHKNAINSNVRRIVESSQARIDSIGELVKALDPMRVIERGFSIVYARDGTIVRSVSNVEIGDGVYVQVADGEIESKVIQTKRKK